MFFCKISHTHTRTKSWHLWLLSEPKSKILKEQRMCKGPGKGNVLWCRLILMIWLPWSSLALFSSVLAQWLCLSLFIFSSLEDLSTSDHNDRMVYRRASSCPSRVSGCREHSCYHTSSLLTHQHRLTTQSVSHLSRSDTVPTVTKLFIKDPASLFLI